MDAAAVWAQTVHLFTTVLRPGNVEFSMLVYQPVAYWLVAGFYELLDHLKLPFTERYKVVRREPGRENTITKTQVVLRVLLQQFIQTLLNLAVFIFDTNMCADNGSMPFLQRVARFVLGLYVMDTWQYWIHRLMHTSTFLYKHLHSTHHSLWIPYASGALYNSVLEGLVLDSLGGVVTLYAAGLDCSTAVCVFTFGQIKTVLDHCNYRGPLNPLHGLFPNCAAYHDIHHDVRGLKANFSQPFFTHWDWVLGTFMDPAGLHLSVDELQEQQEGKQQRQEEGKAKAKKEQ